MLRNVMSSRVALGIFSLAALFFGLVGYANPEVLIIALNGIFTGCMVAIVVLTID